MDSPPDSTSQKPKKAIRNPFSVMQADEKIVCEIKRHPIGILGMYAAIGVLLAVVTITTFVVMPHELNGYSHSQASLLSAIIVIIAATLCGGFLFIISKIYWGNGWIVTSDSITQIRQTSLFDKQTSQLSLGSLEDITAEQDGVLEQMLHYGTLSAETAGANDRFIFPFCPDPNRYANKILAARENFEQQRRQIPDKDDQSQAAPRRSSARTTVDVGIAAVESLSKDDQ